MNLKLYVGIALFLIGIVAAFLSMADIGNHETRPLIESESNASNTLLQAVEAFAMPALAGLLLAIGGLLIGLSKGNWSRPRTHLEPGDEVVDPEGYHKMKHV